MKSGLAILASLVAGALVAVALMAAFVLVGPDPIGLQPTSAPTVQAPSLVPPSAPPSSSLVPSVGADGSGGPVPSIDPGAAFHIGQPAPALVVPQLGGGTIDLTNLRGKPVWLNFMQTTCLECVDEFPLMNGFSARYANTGLVVIAIDIREDAGAVATFAKRLATTFPLGLDLDGKAQQTWGAYAIPIHFWIDTGGIVRAGALGGVSADTMAAGLRKVLNGVAVTP
ncbi:MAG: hypothetical protein NVS9B8_08990 [Candidatus Limnocylindrales bacterium]